MNNNNYIINYSGHLDSESIDTLINAFKEEQEALGIEVKIFKKIITIMIESLENIYKYTRTIDNREKINIPKEPIFNIKKEDGNYIIKAGNPIFNDDIPGIRKRIDYIKELDNDKLKELYIDTIRNGRFSNQGGAGLGFIKIARVTNNKIDYKLEKLNKDLSFFTLYIILSEKK